MRGAKQLRAGFRQRFELRGAHLRRAAAKATIGRLELSRNHCVS